MFYYFLHKPFLAQELRVNPPKGALTDGQGADIGLNAPRKGETASAYLSSIWRRRRHLYRSWPCPYQLLEKIYPTQPCVL